MNNPNTEGAFLRLLALVKLQLNYRAVSQFLSTIIRALKKVTLHIIGKLIWLGPCHTWTPNLMTSCWVMWRCLSVHPLNFSLTSLFQCDTPFLCLVSRPQSLLLLLLTSTFFSLWSKQTLKPKKQQGGYFLSQSSHFVKRKRCPSLYKKPYGYHKLTLLLLLKL